MKPATTALINYLDANDNVVVTDLYTISIVGGTILRLIDYPLASVTIPAANFPGSPLNYSPSGSVTFTRGPKLGRSKVATKIGMQPAELDVDIYASTTDTIGDLTWQQLEVAGGFDGATVELDRFFMPIGSDGVAGPIDLSLGAIVWFYGLVAETEISRTLVKLKVKALINLLQQQQMPRRLFQAGCTHVYGGTMCGYDRVNGKNALGVPTGVGEGNFFASALSTQWVVVDPGGPVAQFYALGTCTCTSGANASISRGIMSVGTQSSNVPIYLTRPFPFPIASGDAFTLLPGCDHTLSTCNDVMLNILRYGGFDYIPPPELAV